MFDRYASKLIKNNINLMIPWYLMSSYAYYKEDNPIVSDAFYDNMCKQMIIKWDNIKHIHKEHISLDDLYAGTFLGKYPSIIKGALKEVRNKKKRKRLL